MTNHYKFICPIKGGDAVQITHCEDVHSKVMSGKPDKCENKLCAVASLSYMCPFRNAGNFMGKWSEAGKYPHWDAPREKPDTLPPVLLQASLARLLPKDSDYRRVGAKVQEFYAHLQPLAKKFGVNSPPHRDGYAASSGAEVGSRTTRKGSVKPEAKRKENPESIFDDIKDTGSEMAASINKRIAEESAVGALSSDESAPSTHRKQKQKTPPRDASLGSVDGSAKPISLAQRAKLMKQRKEEQNALN